MTRRLGLSFVALLFACSTAASTPSTPSTTDAAIDDGAIDAAATDADASPATDGGWGTRDCALSETDRDDAGAPLMTIDRSQIGEICWTPGAAEIAGCPSGNPCVAYRLPEDPPGTHRCGPGCDAVACPGEHSCVMTLSGLPSVRCDCW